MNWEIGIDIYTPICIKLITNKNLIYKKNKIKLNSNIKKVFALLTIPWVSPGVVYQLSSVEQGLTAASRNTSQSICGMKD